MLLFKILQEFLLPSVFVLVLILTGIILIFRKKRGELGKILIILGILFYYLFSITPVADLILLPLERQYKPLAKEDFNKADKIVLLLGGKESSILRASEVTRLWQELGIKNKELRVIISGTNPLNPEINEAEEVKEFLAERGVSPENIILEEKSKTTKESAQNLKELLAKEPFFLVTSAYHMKRAMETFKKLGFDPIPAPADFKIEKDYDLLDFFPDAQNLRNSDLTFHEYFGALWYGLNY